MKWKKHPIYNIECSENGDFRRLDNPNVKPRLFGWSNTKYHYRCRVAPNIDKQLHRLVYECFYCIIPDGLVVIHLDEYHPYPNSIENLALSSDRINHIDKVQKGRSSKQCKELNPNSKLTKEEVSSIISMRENGMTYRKLSKIFGVSHPTIISIIKRKTWA